MAVTADGATSTGELSVYRGNVYKPYTNFTHIGFLIILLPVQFNFFK